ncbi:MAG: nuclear transport factor 2 family protein [Phenylobacterium sp.]|nr:MAG: nuclear transport factor 2 family protein [Phenylobacterium sp.]
MGVVPRPAVAGAGPAESTAKDIRRLENLYSQSFVTGDAHVAERLLADDFIGFGSSGKPSDKAGMLAEVRTLPHQVSAKITSITVRVHGNTAIALGTEDDASSPSQAVSHREWLDTWRRHANGWRMVASAEIEPKN